MNSPNFIPLKDYQEFKKEEMLERSQSFYNEMNRRRTVRQFSGRSVPKKIIENCIVAAGTAPSGANMQPWHFVVVGRNDIKRKIRIAAEEEEKEFYNNRAPKAWLDALKPLGTNEEKPFLETAPYLIAVFSKKYDLSSKGKKIKQYYSIESTGIATGILITALHHAGLVSLTHTPSPMNFLNTILNRPSNEKPFLLIVTGYPAKDTLIPDIKRKSLSQISSFIE